MTDHTRASGIADRPNRGGIDTPFGETEMVSGQSQPMADGSLSYRGGSVANSKVSPMVNYRGDGKRGASNIANGQVCLEQFNDEEAKMAVKFLLRLRELYAGFVGITLAFTIINFAFTNITGGCLVLFGLLSAFWSFIDRHHTTYILNGIIQLLLAVSVGIAVCVYFPGFEAYATDELLRSISVAHVPLAFLFFILSIYLAWVDTPPLDEASAATGDTTTLPPSSHQFDAPADNTNAAQRDSSPPANHHYHNSDLSAAGGRSVLGNTSRRQDSTNNFNMIHDATINSH